MKNIDEFNKAAALVLARLYEAFPTPVTLNSAELAPDDETFGQVVAATIQFLVAEGLVRGSQPIAGGQHMSFASLTMRGLSILDAIPDSLKTSEPLGQRLRKSLGSGAKEALRAAMGEVIRLGVTGAGHMAIQATG